MITDSAAVVMLAIRSAIKLGRQMRLAYIDSTKQRALILPLPDFFNTPDIVSAANYFAADGRSYAEKMPQLRELLAKKPLTAAEETEVLVYYTEFFNLDRAKAGKLGSAADGSTITGNAFNALITVRQWQRGADPNPSTLQRFCGAFIEIGIDYFLNVPGALNKDSGAGRALTGFLQAMSDIKFSEDSLGGIPGRLFAAVIETISGHPELLTADAKVQELVKVATQSLSMDVAKRIEEIRKTGQGNLVKEERIADWTELVFRSLLSSAGGLVMANPQKFLGLEENGQAALVGTVGQSILGLVLDNDDLWLDRLFSRDGLEKITKSALTVVGDHPEILHLSGNTGLQKLISAVAAELSRYETPLTPDLLPEMTRLILDKTGENLSLLWPELAEKPQNHLLLTAAGVTLDLLSRKAAGHRKWQLRFSREDILIVTEAVFDELTANPTWLIDKTGKINDNLKMVMEASLGVLRDRADRRMCTATAIAVLHAVILTAGTRQEFLEKMPAGLPQQGLPLVAAVIDAVFAAIFDDRIDARAAWQVVRNETIVSLVNIGLTELGKVKLNADKVMQLSAFVKDRINALAAGQPLVLPLFESALRQVIADD